MFVRFYTQKRKSKYKQKVHVNCKELFVDGNICMMIVARTYTKCFVMYTYIESGR